MTKLKPKQPRKPPQSAPDQPETVAGWDVKYANVVLSGCTIHNGTDPSIATAASELAQAAAANARAIEAIATMATRSTAISITPKDMEV